MPPNRITWAIIIIIAIIVNFLLLSSPEIGLNLDGFVSARNAKITKRILSG